MENISDKVNDEFSKSSTKPFYEMFLALTEPPSYFERLYSKTIYGPQSRLILLASNIVNKSPKKFKLKAKHIFKKIFSIILIKNNIFFCAKISVLVGWYEKNLSQRICSKTSGDSF